MTSLTERMDWLSRGRPYYKWLTSIGIARDTVNRFKKQGAPLTDAALSALVRVEGVSFSWLTEGIGKPFQQIASDDDASAEQLACLLSEEVWTTYLLHHWGRAVIVLTLPAAFQGLRGKATTYTEVEMLLGGQGRTLAVANYRSHALFELDVDESAMEMLEAGMTGAYDLLGEHPGALLKKARLVSLQNRGL